MQSIANEQLNTVVVPIDISSREHASALEDSANLKNSQKQVCGFKKNTDYPNVGSKEFEDVSKAFARHSLSYKIVKRLFDIAFSLIVIAIAIAILPLTVAVLFATAISTKGSPFYTQLRVGRFGKPFRILKLRTMVADSDDVEKYLSDDQLEQWRKERKVDGDPRITGLGLFFRKTSLDELPQFINVLAGQMSIIGPRAISKEELNWYSFEEQVELLSVPQGITGWWQVRARNDASFQNGERQVFELEYCRNAGLGMDLKVFMATFGTMFGKGKTGR